MQIAKWVDKNGVESEPPFAVESVGDAISWYRSIYDENQTNSLPPTIGLPPKDMSSPSTCVRLSAEAQAASVRTKEELMSNKKCVIC